MSKISTPIHEGVLQKGVLQKAMTPKQIGAAVRKARGQRSIREVAGAAGLHRDQVTSIEKATKAYTMPVFLKLVKALGGWTLVFQAKGSEAHSAKGATGSKDV